MITNTLFPINIAPFYFLKVRAFMELQEQGAVFDLILCSSLQFFLAPHFLSFIDTLLSIGRETNSFIVISLLFVHFIFLLLNFWWVLMIIMLCMIIVFYFRNKQLKERIRTERILNYFATSLYGQNTVEDIFWDIAKNCISKLNFEDCVIYQYDEERKVLVQKAAFGPKNPEKYEILNPIEIPLDKGIVGSVAASGKSEIVPDATKDSRYIIDDQQRMSEITVPVFVEGKLFGIIDSEHHKKGFFTRYHLTLLEKIAIICTSKISKYLVEEKLRVKIARDLHDEIGSTLTSINIISKMALQQVDAHKDVYQNLQKINEYSGKMMESMSDIVWAINPANDTLDKIIIRMKEFAAEMLEPAQINYYFKEEGNVNSVKLNLEQRKDLYLIYKEVLNNSVKYSGATEIMVLLHQDNNYLKMQITDNGKGFDASKKFSGNGLKNIHYRADQMSGELHLQSIPGAGTTVSMQVPVTF